MPVHTHPVLLIFGVEVHTQVSYKLHYWL